MENWEVSSTVKWYQSAFISEHGEGGFKHEDDAVSSTMMHMMSNLFDFEIGLDHFIKTCDVVIDLYKSLTFYVYIAVLLWYRTLPWALNLG